MRIIVAVLFLAGIGCWESYRDDAEGGQPAPDECAPSETMCATDVLTLVCLDGAWAAGECPDGLHCRLAGEPCQP